MVRGCGHRGLASGGQYLDMLQWKVERAGVLVWDKACTQTVHDSPALPCHSPHSHPSFPSPGTYLKGLVSGIRAISQL